MFKVLITCVRTFGSMIAIEMKVVEFSSRLDADVAVGILKGTYGYEVVALYH